MKILQAYPLRALIGRPLERMELELSFSKIFPRFCDSCTEEFRQDSTVWAKWYMKRIADREAFDLLNFDLFEGTLNFLQ